MDQSVRHHRTQMVVNARAKEARISAGIFRRSRSKILDDFILRKRARKAQRSLQPELPGNGCEQIVNGFRADGREHFAALGWTLWKIAHQAEASFSEMNAW